MNLNGLGADKNILIMDELDKRGITWSIYVDSFPHIPRVGAATGASFMSRWDNQIKTMSQFSSDAKHGTLPQVTFVDAKITEDANGNDEHPPGDIQLGQKFVSDRVHELFASPQWKSLALFITYDEHGGIYDHVAPPPACPPDDIEPKLENDEDQEFAGRFDRLGVRVPFILVSPFAKKAYVSHKTYDHTSITRFIEAKFRLPALSNRDANADPLLDLFDFDRAPFASPPSIAPAIVDSSRLDTCRSIFAPPPPSHNNHG
jgi:phospholipase C